MTAEHLREFIVEEQRPICHGEPNAHSIANHLAALQWWVFETEDKQRQSLILEIFKYTEIGNLRTDAEDLIILLRSELDEEQWKMYFHRRIDHTPFIKV